MDSGGLTVRQKVRLPPLRLGPAPLAISEGYVTTLKSDHDVEVGECCCSCALCPPLNHLSAVSLPEIFLGIWLAQGPKKPGGPCELLPIVVRACLVAPVSKPSVADPTRDIHPTRRSSACPQAACWVCPSCGSGSWTCARTANGCGSTPPGTSRRGCWTWRA